MKTSSPHFLCCLAVFLLALNCARTLHAANITWGPAQDITGDADVITAGSLVGAFNVGDGFSFGIPSYPSVPATTVNGVTFSPFEIHSTVYVVSSAVALSGGVTFTLSTSDLFLSHNTVYGNIATPFSSLSANYRTLLQSSTITAAPATMTLTMSGLIVGRTYQFQWWSNTAGPLNSGPGSQRHSASTGNTVILDDNSGPLTSTGLHGGVGQYAIGTFVANATTQVITFAHVGTGPQFTQINAFQLRIDHPTITTVTPNPVPGRNSPQSFIINGAYFHTNCTVTLRNLTTGETFPNRTKIAQTASTITLNPNFGTPSHTWSVEVINPGPMSSGQFPFAVNAPVAAQQITSLGTAIVVADGASQTIEVNGLNLIPGSQVELRSLDTNFSTVLPANVFSATGAIFNYLFDKKGSWTVKMIAPNGEPTQPLRCEVADSSGFHLGFPLKEGGRLGGGNPFNTRISSVLDHQSGPGITTFDGERFTLAISNTADSDYRHPLGRHVLQGVADFAAVDVASYNNHDGYDYLGSLGSDGKGGVDNVYAAGSGTFESFADYNGSHEGNYIRITHGETGYKTVYLHLHSFAPGFTPDKSGGTVREGEIIGKVGTTGKSTGPHLHFSAKRKKSDGTFVVVDPYGWYPNPGTDSNDPAPLSITNLWRGQDSPSVSASPQLFSSVASGGAVLAASIHAGQQSYQATVTSGASWLTVLSGQTGTGDATLTLAAANNAGPARTGLVTVGIPIGGPIEIRVEQLAGAPGQNPAPDEIAAQIKTLAKQYQIPTPIIAAVAYKESTWQQFDGAGNPVVGPTGDVGLMQINVQNPAIAMDVQRVGSDWNYNLEIGCKVLREKWKKNAVDTVSPWDDQADTDPAILENWYYPVAWYNGEGDDARAYIGAIWNYLKSPPVLLSSYFAAIPDLGDPTALGGFPTTIYPKVPTPRINNLATAEAGELISHGMYTLMLLRRAGESTHRWNWDSNSATQPFAPAYFSMAALASVPETAVDITESIGSEPGQLTFDQWATALGSEEIDPLADRDGDGLVSLVEFALGGDPDDPSSKPDLAVNQNAANLEMVAKIPKYTKGVMLEIEHSTDCVTWTSASITPNVLAENSVSRTFKWVVPASGPKNFIRLRVTASE